MPYFAKEPGARSSPQTRGSPQSRRPGLPKTQSSHLASGASSAASSSGSFVAKRAGARDRTASGSGGTEPPSPGGSAKNSAKNTPASSKSLSGETRKARAKSVGQVLASNMHHANQYLAQERVYLRRIRNEAVDDYYTKGIRGAAEPRDDDAGEDDDEDDLRSAGPAGLLADLDDGRFQMDFSLAYDIIKATNLQLRLDAAVKTISRDTVEDRGVLERLEWQAMLSSVLTGDVVKSEKTKIDTGTADAGQELFLHAHYKESLWFGIRARLLNRTDEDQRRNTLYRRTLVDGLLEDVLAYEVVYDASAAPPREQVAAILDRYGRACELWRTLEEMRHDKPVCGSEAFVERIDALTAWLTIADAIERNTRAFRVWIGNDALDVTRAGDVAADPDSKVQQIFDEDNKLLAEKIVKEKDVHTVFRKRIFEPLAPWIVKSKETYIRLGHMFEVLKLPDYGNDLLDLCLVPMRLIKEIMRIRMKYARRLENPTLMMIDQMIDDFKSYLTIALEVKAGILDFCRPDPSRTWVIEDLFERDLADFDAVVLLCVRYFLVLLNKKLVDSARSPHLFRTNKEPEVLEDAWNFLKSIGDYIDGGSMVVAENVASITLRLCHKLLAYFNHQVRHPPPPTLGSADLIRWYNSTTENFGQLRRKLARFTGEMSRTFTNAFVFEILNSSGVQMKVLLNVFRETGHFLVYTGSSEVQGMYFFASPELADNDDEILRIISGGFLGVDLTNTFNEFSDMINKIRSDGADDAASIGSDLFSAASVGYVIALCPSKPIVWEGDMINLAVENIPITDLKVGQLMLVTRLPFYTFHVARDKFVDLESGLVSVGSIVKQVDQRSSLTKIHQELMRINKTFFRMTLSVFDNVQIVISKCRELIPNGGYQELVNQFFIYARDFGKSLVRWSDSNRKSMVIMRLIHLSIQWVSFICDDCIPTDRKTFRWCVLALEYAMEMTKGFNVLVLTEDQFYKLKLKVARCMSLLISHFDIMGARSSEAEKRRLLKWTSQRLSIENATDDDSVLRLYRDDLMELIDEIENYRTDVQKQLNSVGRVLDVSDLEYQFVTLLASSFSSVSIRWQKGKFIGSGSFGQVSAAVNLDTGGVMAVKEIVFHDSQSLKLIPSIKEEMTVLEMLNHPNVVQYFGVEVHRDKVYIFMEFCEGGSLSGLLAHGRIEDEMVIQVYTLQMLEGLAYLHQSGVVHRDIKPENILLDHNGVIKFVDFGAAKVIAASGRTRAASTRLRSGSTGGNNPENLNSMTGTPMYMSPEVITGQSTAKNGVVDIWSLGCCVLEMATGRRPWANLDNEWAIMYHIAAGHKPQLPSPDQLSESGRSFLSRCLEHDPTKRPSATELLNDPWIVQIRQAAFGSSESSTPILESGPDLPEHSIPAAISSSMSATSSTMSATNSITATNSAVNSATNSGTNSAPTSATASNSATNSATISPTSTVAGMAPTTEASK